MACPTSTPPVPHRHTMHGGHHPAVLPPPTGQAVTLEAIMYHVTAAHTVHHVQRQAAAVSCPANALHQVVPSSRTEAAHPATRMQCDSPNSLHMLTKYTHRVLPLAGRTGSAAWGCTGPARRWQPLIPKQQLVHIPAGAACIHNTSASSQMDQAACSAGLGSLPYSSDCNKRSPNSSVCCMRTEVDAIAALEQCCSHTGHR
jgi:hypothetical protein